jgi:hypothetical protein
MVAIVIQTPANIDVRCSNEERDRDTPLPQKTNGLRHLCNAPVDSIPLVSHVLQL